MRETRNAQVSIFDFYAEQELGYQLRALSDLLDELHSPTYSNSHHLVPDQSFLRIGRN